MTLLPQYDFTNSFVPREISEFLLAFGNKLLNIRDVVSIVLFGSYSKGTYDKDSDIDIAVFVCIPTGNTDEDDRLHSVFREAQFATLECIYDVQILVFDIRQMEEPMGILEEVAMFGQVLTDRKIPGITLGRDNNI